MINQMEHFIKELDIVNFKSIKHLKLTDFRRINLFIGRPNVGKSNILEALSLFSIPFLIEYRQSKLNDLIRLEESIQFFYDGNYKDGSSIRIVDSTEKQDLCKVKFERNHDGLEFKFTSAKSNNLLFEDEVVKFHSLKRAFSVSLKDGKLPRIKKYIFRDVKKSESRKRESYLYPPFGANLLYVLELQPELREIFVNWFNLYGLRLVLDKASNSLKILKDAGNEVFILPYSSIADTLQRIIFYKTAVASNENSVLIFEEPEAHAFPPYIAEFTQEVIHSKTNQFIMATHSPIIVNDFLENAREDLSIFMVDFKDGQTVAKPLSREEIEEVYVNGVDLFFNNEAYIK